MNHWRLPHDRVAVVLVVCSFVLLASASSIGAQGIPFQTRPHVFYFGFDEASGVPLNASELAVATPPFLPPGAATLRGGAVLAGEPPLAVGERYLRLPGTTPDDRLDTNVIFGLNPFADVPMVPDERNDDEWTIEFWIYLEPGPAPVYPQHVFGEPTAAGFDCRTTDGTDLVLTSTLLATVTIGGFEPLTWHHVAFVFDVTAYHPTTHLPAAASLLGYRDGTLVASVAQPNANASIIGAAASGLAIGGSGALPSMRGRIDEFRLWYQARNLCQLVEQCKLRLPLHEFFAPYGLPPGHPDGPDPIAASGGLDPEVHGKWDGPWDWESDILENPTAAFDELAHAVLLPTGPHRGEVLLWINDLMVPTTRTFLFDPASPESLGRPENQPTIDIFCSGHSIRSDGVIVVPGGVNPLGTDDQPREIHLFDPLGLTWEYVGDMCAQRFYPTVISLTRPFDGRSLVLGGTPTALAAYGDAGTSAWETYPGSHTCGVIAAATNDETPVIGTPPLFELYPRMEQLSTGQVLVVDTPTLLTGNSSPGQSWLISLPTTPGHGLIDEVSSTVASDRAYGSMVLMHCRPENGGPDLVLDFGGSATDAAHPPCRTAQSTVDRFDLATATWSAASPSLLTRRFCVNAVILPTGDVFVVGGGYNDPILVTTNGEEGNDWIAPVFLPELYTPGGESRWLAPPNHGFVAAGHPTPLIPFTPRVYHHVALLLPDGTVFVAGGEELFADRNYTGVRMAKARHTGEVFNPPYRYHSPRPRITKCPDKIELQGSVPLRPFTMRVGTLDDVVGPATIDRVVLMRPGAVTHHFDNDQRYIELAFTVHGGTSLPGPLSLSVAPPSESLAPAGFYMLFVVARNAAGQRIPSDGVWIQLI